MIHDEAMKLARYVQEIIWKAFSRDTFHDDVEKLCDYILSGSMKREIENAALRRAIELCKRIAITYDNISLEEEQDDQGDDAVIIYNNLADGANACEKAISALIQPPAQKEDGK